MSYYTERHGLRTPIERTETISFEMYSLLYDCCARFFDNVAWQYPDECPDGNGCCGLDLGKLSTAMSFEIPTLFRNQNGIIDKPHKGSWNYDDDNFDQYGLLDFIEFMYSNCKDISSRWWHSFHRHYDISFDNTRASANEFKSAINGIFEKTGLLYTLTDQGMVERIVENGVLSKGIEATVLQVKEKGLKELLDDAILAYKTPHPAARKDAVEKIWDALERLKSYYATSKKDKTVSISTIVAAISGGDDYFRTLFDNEFRVLSDIGNSCFIRHSEVYQNQIEDNRYYDYFFNRCLSLIALTIQYLRTTGTDDAGGETDGLPF
ncbi:hypothetical protein B1779_01115 [Dehalococcoides mccartyi]|uniref:AbiJ-NTD4 domain-containing protein n=1 Tax=Dehalococcoides mccartyi TaxID=61435 RepID=UPI000994ACE9|nr:hypothetical protein [Dehalococcoides mccartyi]AQW61918.1 hypothetical protein B1779_01115 [Dehalococcoides mccartyi]